MTDFLGGRVVLHAGDCREVIRSLADSSIDSVVCDPPYALVSIAKRFGKPGSAEAKGGVYQRSAAGFMGKRWDNGEAAFAAEFWAEVLRVLKPGGHVLAFSGTRTYHRLAVAIEDAGFEIRDCIYWHYGSGFPKSHNISKRLTADGAICSCSENVRNLRQSLDAADPLSGRSEPDLQQGMQGSANRLQKRRPPIAVQPASDDHLRRLRSDEGCPASVAEAGGEADMLAPLQRHPALQGIGEAQWEHEGQEGHTAVRPEQPGMEGRGDLSEPTRELRLGEIRPVPASPDLDGSQGRLRDGASAGHGGVDRATTNESGDGSSSGPSAAQQSEVEPGALADQQGSQAGGVWPVCGGCGKPVVPDGLGTALKPATEPICLARKPLTGTVADNVLAHGTGALNIDDCRIQGGGPSSPRGSSKLDTDAHEGWLRPWMEDRDEVKRREDAAMKRLETLGRWPANIIHDGSDEVLDAFPADLESGKPSGMKAGGQGHAFGHFNGGIPVTGFGDSGNAARFFYTAKADADDRLGSKHPTVKPLDLMQYLVRLVTPPGGLVLDPFAGTGTTGEAAFREGMRAVLIEREPEYQADIARRMELAENPTKRAAVAKSKNNLQGAEGTPLFGGEAA